MFERADVWIMYIGTIQTSVADVWTGIADKYVPLYAPEINYNCKFERKCARCKKTNRQTEQFQKENLQMYFHKTFF